MSTLKTVTSKSILLKEMHIPVVLPAEMDLWCCSFLDSLRYLRMLLVLLWNVYDDELQNNILMR